MKFIWEAKDIVGGRRYGRPGLNEVWIIGYMSDESVPRHVSISLSDGMVTEARTKDQLAKALSDDGYMPIELLEML